QGGSPRDVRTASRPGREYRRRRASADEALRLKLAVKLDKSSGHIFWHSSASRDHRAHGNLGTRRSTKEADLVAGLSQNSTVGAAIGKLFNSHRSILSN